MPKYLGRDQLALVAAVVGPLAVSAVLVPFRAAISGANLALIVVVVVVAVASNGYRLAGALAALSAAVWFDFFLAKPYAQLAIAAPADVITAVLLLVVGLTVSQLAARARRLHLVAITDADQLAQIHRTAELAQSGTAANDVVNQVRTQLVDLLRLRGCRFEYGMLLGHPPRLERDGSVTVTQSRVHKRFTRDELPDEEVELRVSSGGRYYGRFMLRPTPHSEVPLQARLVAVTLADQAGAAFEAARSAGLQRE